MNESSVRNFLFAAFRATTFGKSPRRMTIAQVFFLASGQDRRQTHTCYFWQAANTGVRSTVPKHSECDCAA